MHVSRPTLERVGATAAYLLAGAVGTAAVALGALYAGQPVQPLVYDLLYLHVGPSGATQAAVLAHFLVAGFTGLGVVLLAGDYPGNRLRHRTELAKGFAVLVGFAVAFLLVALAGLTAFLTALLVLAAAVVTVPLLVRYRYGVRSGGVVAFVGGVPVLVLLLLLAGFGLGWGWGYVMTAQEVPASTVDGNADAAFGEVPSIRADLFAADCETDIDGRRVCRLSLRGYEHEVEAVRFMARHGVRCPYRTTRSGATESFIARDDGSYYRVTCSSHGD